MIHESTPWKKELLKIHSRLIKASSQKRWSDSTFVRVEKDVFFSVYIIRKLMEARKLSDELESQLVTLSFYNIKPDAHLTFFNWHHLDRHYDMDNRKTEQRKIDFFINQLIHSYILMFSFDDNNLFDGVFFTSDHYRKKKLFHVSIFELLRIIKAVASDHVVSASYEFNFETGDYDMVKSSRYTEKDEKRIKEIEEKYFNDKKE